MKISPFQALTILAQQYRNSPQDSLEGKKFNQINQLYLVGIQTTEDKELLDELLKDDALKGYEIALGDKETINNDPVRRYYESMLAHETLKIILDTLDIDRLKEHFNSLFQIIPWEMRIQIFFKVYHGAIDGIEEPRGITATEYIIAIHKLRNPKNFHSLKPKIKDATEETLQNILKERLNKMMLLAKVAHAAMAAVIIRGNNDFPLNIYDGEHSLFQAKRRGRRDKQDLSGAPQIVRSRNLGIMRSYHPLAQDDPLYEDFEISTSGKYRRPADQADYVDGAEMPEKLFAAEVSPFVNSISATMLIQLRIMAKLLLENKFAYKNNSEQLKAFFKSLVSYMIYNSGGHSFQEFMSLFDIPEIQNTLSIIPGFSDINLRTLFQEHNQLAYQSAMDAVIIYSDQFLAKKKLHNELVPKTIPCSSIMFSGVIENDELTKLVRSKYAPNSPVLFKNKERGETISRYKPSISL